MMDEDASTAAYAGFEPKATMADLRRLAATYANDLTPAETDALVEAMNTALPPPDVVRSLLARTAAKNVTACQHCGGTGTQLGIDGPVAYAKFTAVVNDRVKVCDIAEMALEALRTGDPHLAALAQADWDAWLAPPVEGDAKP